MLYCRCTLIQLEQKSYLHLIIITVPSTCPCQPCNWGTYIELKWVDCLDSTTLSLPRKCESMSPQYVPSHSSYRMTRKTPLCRKCGMPMKGHSRSTCLLPKQKDDGILSTPSFVIPETGPFRRQNPNYVPPPPEPLILSSASLTTTEPVFSVNSTTQRSYPPIQQFTPHCISKTRIYFLIFGATLKSLVILVATSTTLRYLVLLEYI